jgi:hypothetical protein
MEFYLLLYNLKGLEVFDATEEEVMNGRKMDWPAIPALGDEILFPEQWEEKDLDSEIYIMEENGTYEVYDKYFECSIDGKITMISVAAREISARHSWDNSRAIEKKSEQ